MDTAAMEYMSRGEHGLLAGLLKGEIVATSLETVVSDKKPLDLRMLEWARVLAR